MLTIRSLGHVQLAKRWYTLFTCRSESSTLARLLPVTTFAVTDRLCSLRSIAAVEGDVGGDLRVE